MKEAALKFLPATEAGIGLEELLPLVEKKIGRPVNAESLRRTVNTLMETGLAIRVSTGCWRRT